MKNTVCLFFFCLSVAQTHSHAQQIALTFDDLPSHGPLPEGLTRAGIAKSIIQGLHKFNAPEVYGFVNGKLIQDAPADAEVLKLWTAAGFTLGSHTWSHIDLHANSAEVFKEDVALNEPALRPYMPKGGWHWFRYPYLHEGETPQKKQTIMAYLRGKGYRIAQVTLSFDDYAWNAPYARCVARKDTPSIQALQSSYLEAAEESLRIGPEMARRIWGHDIKHVMLLHIGAFQTVMLPRLLELLKTKGVKLITLKEAADDDAYRSESSLSSGWGGTLIDQMIRAKGLNRPVQAEARFAKLASICR